MVLAIKSGMLRSVREIKFFFCLLFSFSISTRHPRSLNQQDRSNSAPNVCINNVKSFGIDQRILQPKGPLQVRNYKIFNRVQVNYAVYFRLNPTRNILIQHKHRQQIH